jgi:hypothetical protein
MSQSRVLKGGGQICGLNLKFVLAVFAANPPASEMRGNCKLGSAFRTGLVKLVNHRTAGRGAWHRRFCDWGLCGEIPVSGNLGRRVRSLARRYHFVIAEQTIYGNASHLIFEQDEFQTIGTLGDEWHVGLLGMGRKGTALVDH